MAVEAGLPLGFSGWGPQDMRVGLAECLPSTCAVDQGLEAVFLCELPQGSSPVGQHVGVTFNIAQEGEGRTVLMVGRHSPDRPLSGPVGEE